MATGVYPGTFDPVTFGHLEIVERSLQFLDKLVIGVSTQIEKNPMFSIEERVALLESVLKGYEERVHIEVFGNLLVEFAQDKKADVVVRGLRVISDFEYEFQMALINRRMAPKVETVFLMPNEQHIYLSSTLVKEIASYGGDISPFVPEEVKLAVTRKISGKKEVS